MTDERIQRRRKTYRSIEMLRNGISLSGIDAGEEIPANATYRADSMLADTESDTTTSTIADIDCCNSDDENDKHRRHLQLTLSLDDSFDAISLYNEESEPGSASSRRLTWQEWYLRKKIAALNNEAKMKEQMNRALNKKNGPHANLTEKQKQDELAKWLATKRAQKAQMEKKLHALQTEQAEKKKSEKEKSLAKYRTWLQEVQQRELTDREQRAQKERAERERTEREQQRRREHAEQLRANMKQLVPVRPLRAKCGQAIVNGKMRQFFDWSTSPAPTFVNKNDWQS